MGYRIKYDIGTAVSIALVIGKNADGDFLEQEEIFLPGAFLPANTAPRIIESVNEEGSHLSGLVESANGGPEINEQVGVANGGSVVIHHPPTDNPFTAETAATQEPVDYDEFRRADLDKLLAERQAAGRQIKVSGTGQNGAIKSEDIVKALKEDDSNVA